jgi:hypothetical protein
MSHRHGYPKNQTIFRKSPFALHLLAYMMFAEETHRNPGNDRNQRYQQDSFK